jgi:hypothetical protein
MNLLMLGLRQVMRILLLFTGSRWADPEFLVEFGVVEQFQVLPSYIGMPGILFVILQRLSVTLEVNQVLI